MLPAAVTDAAVTAELPGAQAWAARHHVTLDTWLVRERILRLVFPQGDGEQAFYLQGTFDDYRELPPTWDWWDETWSTNEGVYLSPNSPSTPFGSSMFFRHANKGIICAPFNRLAYQASGGPHSDWSNPAQWMTAGLGYGHAVTIGDMLQSILRDFRLTTGHMA